jgi:hypothetical protein
VAVHIVGATVVFLAAVNLVLRTRVSVVGDQPDGTEAVTDSAEATSRNSSTV